MKKKEKLVEKEGLKGAVRAHMREMRDVEVAAQQEGVAREERERERESRRDLGLLSWGDKVFSLSNI